MIGVLARIKVFPGKEEAFERICLRLAVQTRKHEKGCLFYEVSRLQGEESVYVTMEQYVDAEALERHRNASYILETAPLHAEYFAEPPTLQYLDVLVAN